MPSFEYKALDSAQKMQTGFIEAKNRPDALGKLERQGMRPIKLVEQDKNKRIASNEIGRVQQKYVAVFTGQLASLLEAGIPLARSLDRLAQESSKPHVQACWRKIYELVIDGNSLADACAFFPETFSRVYVAMVRAGETGGFLDVVLSQINEFQEKEKELKSKFVGALTYPAILSLISIIVVVILLVFFIPTFEGIFADFGADLPTLTKTIVGMSSFLGSYGLYICAVLAGGIVWFLRFLKSEQGIKKWDTFILKIPAVGALIRKMAMIRFCRMLGTLINAGIPLLNGLQVARESIGNTSLDGSLRNSIDLVKQGGGLSHSLRDTQGLFPETVLEIVSIAEETGMLDKELMKLADKADKELDRGLRAVVSIVEPAMLFIMAGLIGTIVVGMMLPIFSLQEHIK